MSFFIFSPMKKSILISFLLFSIINSLSAQFTIKIELPKDFSGNEAYLYSLNGSKDILIGKEKKQNNVLAFNNTKSYYGMMKVYFPETNASITFISENRNVDLAFTFKNNKINDIDYKDAANKLFYNIQDVQKKREQILPALYQLQSYYKNDSAFGEALKNEIFYLNSDVSYDPEEYKFIDYYTKNYQTYISTSVNKKQVAEDEIINFLNSTNNYLETSSLLKPILMVFLSNTSKSNVDGEVDSLLKKIDLETPRGQTILSELIEIFDAYGLKDLKDKYLKEAQSLKCSINERLIATIKSNQNTAIGQKISNNVFVSPTNTKAKSLYDVKAEKKIVILWASTCPHCEKEIAEMLIKYNELKSKNIEIVGLSLDTDSKSYSGKVKMLPWINDTELKGWYSSYVDTYNVHATPTFYIVDSNNKILASPDNFSGVLDFLGLK